MVGSQEVIYRDPEIVARLMQVAASAAAKEA
jgi:HD-like signal output (HDOD) protein